MPENPQNSGDKDKKQSLKLKTINIAIEFGFIIIVPLLVFGYLGKWLDTRHGTSYFVIIGILLALAITSLWFYRTIKKLMEQMKDL